jgi:Flp pilus assembly protein TadD
MALCAAAALVAPWSARVRSSRITPGRVVAVLLVAVVTVAAADLAGRLASADRDRIRARDSLRSDPLEALRLANESLALNADSVPALEIKSAAYARLGDYRKARAVLRRAVRLEPHDHLPWALLGDLAVRRGRLKAARRYYKRSSRLNPKSSAIKDFAKDPTSALPERR